MTARNLKGYLVATSIFLAISIFPYAAKAQEASPSPSESPSSQASPSPSPYPSPTPTPSPSVTPSPSSTPTGGTSSADTDKRKVLGAATTLGATSRGREIAKWLIASILGLSAFLLGLKILRSDAHQE